VNFDLEFAIAENESKVSLLKSLPQSEGKLVLFEADIYNPNDFDHAIEGCEFVFHVATPMIHDPGSQVCLSSLNHITLFKTTYNRF